MVTAIAAPRTRSRLRRRSLVLNIGTVVRVLPFLAITVLVLDYVVAVVRPATRGQVWLWTTATMAFPIWFVGGVMFVAVAATIVAGALSVTRPLVVDVLLVVEMTLYYLGTKIWPMTGDQLGWLQNAATRTVAMSEPLADLSHKIPYWITGSLDSVRYVSPVFGAVTIAVYLLLARRLTRTFQAPLWVFRAFIVASPLPFWFITGYVENTFLAIPFLLLGIERTMAFFESDRRTALIAGSASFAVAGLFHAGFALMCFAFAGALLLRSVRLRRRVVDLGIGVVTVLATVVAILGVIKLLPVDLVPGNSQGGYDGDLFAPFVINSSDPMARYVFVSHAHLIEVANIVVHAAPAVVLALPAAAFFAWRRRELRQAFGAAGTTQRQGLTILACTAVVYLAFISVWGFDLGPVGDLDLMLTMGSGLGIYALALLASMLRDRVAILATVLLLSGAVNIAFYSMKVANVWVS